MTATGGIGRTATHVGGRRRLLGRSAAWDRALLVVALLAIWELVVGLDLIDNTLVAAPSSIVVGIVDLAQLGDVRQAFATAIVEVLVAFGLAAVAGVLIGAILGLSRWADEILSPAFVLLFATPKMIFIPLVLLTLGFEGKAKIVYAFVSAILPVIITVSAGVRLVDERLLRAARSMGASRAQIIRHVVIPGSLPSIFTGLWYGIQAALLGVLIMELFISQQGIGHFISTYTANFQADRVYALVVSLALVAVALSAAWRWIEHRVTRWRAAGAR